MASCERFPRAQTLTGFQKVRNPSSADGVKKQRDLTKCRLKRGLKISSFLDLFHIYFNECSLIPGAITLKRRLKPLRGTLVCGSPVHRTALLDGVDRSPPLTSYSCNVTTPSPMSFSANFCRTPFCRWMRLYISGCVNMGSSISLWPLRR